MESSIEQARPRTVADEAPSVGRVAGGGPGWSAFYVGNEFGLIVLILGFGLFFALAAPGFTSNFNLYTLGRTMAVDIMIGFSMMVVIVTGGLNLSVGAIGACSVMLAGWLLEAGQLPLALGLAGGLAMGALLGFVNGYAIVRSGVHSFIITLATMSIFFGGMVFLTHAQAFRELPPALAAFGKAKLMGTLSPLLLISIGVALALAYLYRLTGVGRRMLAAGAKPMAAELSGVRVGRTIILCHMLSGVLAAIAGEMLAARHGAAIPSMAGQLGQDWLLPAFLAPVLGGTLLTGGRVSVLGTFLGAALVSMLTNGLLLLRVGEFWVQACLGGLLLAAVLLDKLRRVVLARRRMV